MNSETRACQNCSQNFTIEPDDFSFYEKMGVPAPTHCPRCRRLRRLAWRNDSSLYSRECTLCQKKFISIYAPNSGFKVLCPKCFHSDDWNPYDYGVEYDPTKSFLEQCIALHKNTLALGVVNDNDIASINCLYPNDLAFSKNCAMVFIGWRLENVFNSFSLAAGKNLSDCLCIAEESQYTYDAVAANGVANCKSVYWCSSSVGCAFCYDCRGCTDCFMSSGLRNKKYFYKNQQYSKEDYEKILASYALETRSGYRKAREEYAEFIKSQPRKFAELQNSINCTGSDIIRGKNTKNSSFASFSEDSKYVHNGVTFKSCYDCEVGGETELAYDCITPDHSYHSIATITSWKNSYVAYCFDCHSSQNLLGCVGIKKGEYAILNKKYSKEAYEALYKKIVADMRARGEWGEFFPVTLSPFGYNETRALDQNPMSREEALAQGLVWQDEIQQTRDRETVAQNDVPDAIGDLSDAITNQILACISCNRNYKILPDELVLYKQLKVPVPEQCFFCRHREREKMRGGYDLVTRQCDCSNAAHNHGEGRCEKNFETFFTDRESRPIYCEDCYQRSII